MAGLQQKSLYIKKVKPPKYLLSRLNSPIRSRNKKGSSNSYVLRKSICSINYWSCWECSQNGSFATYWKTKLSQTSIKNWWRNGMFTIWYLFLSTSTIKNNYIVKQNEIYLTSINNFFIIIDFLCFSFLVI